MIIFDLDGTLADCGHRLHFVENPYSIDGESPDCNCSEPNREFSCPFDDWSAWRPDWKAFYEACDKDKPISPTCELYSHYFCAGHEIEIWSGRCESTRNKTIDWILENVLTWIYPKEYEQPIEDIILKMRPIGDNTPDYQLKERWLDEALAEGKTIDFVFDDRPKVVRMWRRRGIFVFNCSQQGQEFYEEN